MHSSKCAVFDCKKMKIYKRKKQKKKKEAQDYKHI